MILEHESIMNILLIDSGEIFSKMVKCKTLKDLIKLIKETTEKSASDYGYEDYEQGGDIKKGSDKLKGDLFEIFAEAFFKRSSTDNRIGIREYKPVSSEDDNGVDGSGVNLNGDATTIQIKYRSNSTAELSERDIKQFPFQSICNYGVDIHSKGNMIIFTNCKGLNWYTKDRVFENRLTIINGSMIEGLIDNNQSFWKEFENDIRETILNTGIDELINRFNKF